MVFMSDWFTAQLEEHFVVHKIWEAKDREAFIASVANDIRAVFTIGSVGANAELIDHLPNLEIITCFGVGFELVDLAAARRRGIPVTNSPGVTDICVADMAMTLMLAASRQIVAADRFVRSGEWSRLNRFPMVTRFSGRRLGILGLGRIGLEIAKRCAGFDMRIAYHNRRRCNDIPYPYFDDLTELAAESDFLVCTCPGGEATFHIVDAKVLAALGSDGILVNIARGPVVDQEALIAALTNGIIRTAALDVYEGEPAVPSALIEMGSVVLSPHAAGSTHDTHMAATANVLRNLRGHFEDGKIYTPVPDAA